MANHMLYSLVGMTFILGHDRVQKGMQQGHALNEWVGPEICNHYINMSEGIKYVMAM